MAKKRVSLKVSKSYIESIKVGPVWTIVKLKIRSDRLGIQAERMNARKP